MKKKAFSLIELMVVLIIVGIISGFAVGSYNSSRQRNVERTIATQLRALAGVSNLYKAKNRAYWDVAGTAQNLATFQATLNTAIDMDDVTETYNSSSPDSFAFYAVSGRYSFTARIDILNTPCCQSGTCRNLPACACGGAPYIVCNSMCVDSQTDRGNCGTTCGTTCGVGLECVAGGCV